MYQKKSPGVVTSRGHPRLTIDYGPSFEVVLNCLYFKLHGFEPLKLVGAAHGLSVGGGVGVGSRRLTMVDGREGLECTGGCGVGE